MSAEPWNEWTPQDLRAMAKAVRAMHPAFEGPTAALNAFADLKDAEQRGERCVLPKEVTCQSYDMWKLNLGDWVVDSKHHEGRGQTQEAAILDLARKLRSR